MKKKNQLKSLLLSSILLSSTMVSAQVQLTKTLPPAGTTFEVWANVSLPNNTPLPATGANVNWDYSNITTTYSNNSIIKSLSEVPGTEQSTVPGAEFVIETIMPSQSTEMNPRNFYQSSGNYLIEVARKNFGTGAPVLHTDTIFEFNLPYQGSTSLNFGPGGGSGLFTYAGYGSLTIGTDNYSNVVMLMEDAAPDTVFYFFTMTPHYHRLARIFFQNGMRIINYYKPTGIPASAPSAPSNLVATPFNSIKLDWQDNSNDEDGFSIEVTSDTSIGNWTQIGQVGTDTNTFIHSGLMPGSTYFYRVRAFNGNGNSNWSNIASATESLSTKNGVANPKSILVYPIPSSSFIYIENIPNGSLLFLTDTKGKRTQLVSEINAGRMVIATQNYPNGLYILQIESNGEIINKRMIFQ